MSDMFHNAMIHPDDMIYNALLNGGEDIQMKYAILGAIHDSVKPKKERKFCDSDDDYDFMNHLVSIVKSAYKANSTKVTNNLKLWLDEVKNDLQIQKDKFIDK